MVHRKEIIKFTQDYYRRFRESPVMDYAIEILSLAGVSTYLFLLMWLYF
jgi:hypothetical protein